MELDDHTYDKITQLSEEGNKLFHSEQFDAALVKFNEALELVPEPKQIGKLQHGFILLSQMLIF